MKLSGDARDIYKKIKSMISSKILLNESKKLFQELKPVSNVNEIRRRQNYLKKEFGKVDVNLKNEILKVKPFKIKRSYFYDRVFIATEDEFDEASSLSLCPVELEPVDAPIILSKSADVGIEVEEISDVEIAPEIYVESLIEQRESLEAVAKIIESCRGDSVASELLEYVKDFQDLHEKKKILDSLIEIIAREEVELNRRIERKLRRKSIKLEGEALIEFLKSGSISLSEIENLILEEIVESEKRLSDQLGTGFIEVFPRTSAFPVKANPEAVERVKREVEAEIMVQYFLKARKVARRIKELLPHLEKEIEEVFRIELVRGIKEFCEGFVFPEIAEGRISFVEGRNLFIENPQPISYYIGRTHLGDHPVVVLTGANSGGKTSLLELVAQIQIMAQMGLPVNAKMCEIDVVNELFFFRKKRIIYGAGAFEDALKKLSGVLIGDGKKLILVDEFEAITEPGAAVRIISKILEIAYKRRYYFVLVTHLGQYLNLEFCRIDGIEAKGLDENLNLIVDRQPKFGIIGKSTPELIVERLYRKSKGEAKSVLGEIFSSLSKDVKRVELRKR